MAEYYSLGLFDSQGVPKYLESIDTVIPSLLDRILEAVPERTNIPKDKPDFIGEDISRNIIIRNGEATVYMTFLCEGAGYKNTIGYYHYPLPTSFDGPTKLVGEEYVPMTYNDRNAKNSDGKSILNKTIVFPNASLPTWANNNGTNLQAGGGNLHPGSKVKLLYDVNKPDVPFPNNTGIGFFVIPNGWNGKTYTNWAESVHTDSVFNSKNYVQTIPLFDGQTSTDDNCTMIIAFEDIMRPSGDCDFNDVIIKLDVSPRASIITDKYITLPESHDIEEDNIAIDKTGIYYKLKDETLNNYRKEDCEEFEFVHKIKMTDDFDHKKTLTQIFKDCNLENDGYLAEDSDGEDDVTIKYKVKKDKLHNYNYFLNCFVNREITSPINKNVSALVELQNIYLIDDEKCIKDQTLCIRDSTNKDKKYKYGSVIPTINNNGNPYCLGDPHIKTIYNFRYDLPNDHNIYQLYNDGETIINAQLDNFYMNDNIKELKDLTFIHYLSILIKNRGYIIIDMYHPDTYYIYGSNNKFIKVSEHATFTFLNKEDVLNNNYNEYVKITGTEQFILRYINFNTNLLSNVYVELLFITHRKDLVNSVSIISNNLLMTGARGALISPKQVYVVDTLV